MVVAIGSNIASLNAQRQQAKAVDDAARTYERLSSGLRINRASDDAAGLAISSGLDSGARVYTQAIRNGNDAISALGIAQGSLSELNNVLIRVRELATQSSNGTFFRKQRISMDTEASSLRDEFNRIVGTTSFNGLGLLDGSNSSMRIQLGYGSSGGIGVALGAGLAARVGAGTYTNSASIGSGPAPGTLDSGDFNGDGYADVAINYSDDGSGVYQLQVSLSNGDGTFKTPTVVATFGSQAQALKVGDFNGDGSKDIVVDQGSNLEMFAGDGKGGFAAPVTTGTSAAFLGPSYMSIVDVNGDGRQDLVSRFVSNVNVFLGNADGSFQPMSTFSTGFNGNIAVADVDGDGKVDIAQARGASGVRVFLGTGSGGFSSTGIDSTGFTATSIVAGDLNYDGIADIVTSSGAASARIALAQGNGSFSLSQNLTLATAGTLNLFDANSDGHLDIVNAASASGISVYSGNGNGTFSSTRAFTNQTANGYDTVGDYNGDGVLDFISGTAALGSEKVWLGNTGNSTSMARVNLTTMLDSRDAIGAIDKIINRVQSELGNIGAAQSRIESALNSLGATKENTIAASSRIKDVDVSFESANLVRNQIIQQASSAVLAQANQAPSLALQLLRI